MHVCAAHLSPRAKKWRTHGDERRSAAFESSGGSRVRRGASGDPRRGGGRCGDDLLAGGVLRGPGAERPAFLADKLGSRAIAARHVTEAGDRVVAQRSGYELRGLCRPGR